MLKKRLSAPVRKIILFVAVLSVMFCLVCFLSIMIQFFSKSGIELDIMFKGIKLVIISLLLFLFSFAFYKITEFKK